MTPRLSAVAALTAAALLAGCGSPGLRPDDQPTLASLGTRRAVVPADPPLAVTPEQTIAAYRRFIEGPTLGDAELPQRAEALRRLADLEMDAADRKAAADPAGAAPDYSQARPYYEEFLARYPQAPHRDRALYQLARAQEQAGEIEASLKTLTLLAAQHPGTLHASEAQFRRGETLFALRDYAAAEAAYAAVLAGRPAPGTTGVALATPLAERALYMLGWSRFEQGRLDDALEPFFEVLDLELGPLPPIPREEADLGAIRQLSRGDRELVEDSLRAMALALAGLQGTASLPRYIIGPASAQPSLLREGYQFRLYLQLAELYLKQQRIKDAADALRTFVRYQPLHTQAPLFQARVVTIYESNGFAEQALQAKRDHVLAYGADSELRRVNPSAWRQAQPLVKTHLADLARHFHARSQQNHAAEDAKQAERWYRAGLAQFGDDRDAPARRFLLAELLFESQRWADAAAEYERVAYGRGADPRQGADAGYAALLAYAAQQSATGNAAERQALQQQGVASALRFAAAYPTDTRGGVVLTRAAEQLQAGGDGERARDVARQALALDPPPAAAQRRAAWTVVAQQAYETGAYAQAEQAWGQVLPLAADATAREAVAEKQATAIYRQGEAARAAGAARAAVGHFERAYALPGVPATSAVPAAARLDAATALIGLRDWEAAARTLEDFRRAHPGHALQPEVAPKLALVYVELGRHSLAAVEYERVADQTNDRELARSARWQAAELHEKAAKQAAAGPRSALLTAATHGWEHYLQQHPQPLEAAVEARWHLAELARQDGQPARAVAWLKELQQADAAGGNARTPRTRLLAGRAALLAAEPLADASRKTPLVEPLARQLKTKKAKFEEALAAYAAATEVGIAEVAAEATWRSAALYQDFGRALLESARPRSLKKAELEQYNVMLEEQAFPFEEQAIALHEANARRAAAGLYDESVRNSYAALAQLKPVRWGKVERGDAALPAEVGPLQTAIREQAPGKAGAPLRLAALWNQLGIAQRRRGEFELARAAYEAAIEQDPKAAAPQLNLAILHDLYLGDAARASAGYQRCLELAPADAPLLGKWLAELKNRKPATATATSTTTSTTEAATAPAVASRKEAP